jgi:hypothetical protein
MLTLENKVIAEQPAPKPAPAQVRPRTLRLEALEARIAPSAPVVGASTWATHDGPPAPAPSLATEW